jgi:hypothetical protein
LVQPAADEPVDCVSAGEVAPVGAQVRLALGNCLASRGTPGRFGSSPGAVWELPGAMRHDGGVRARHCDDARRVEALAGIRSGQSCERRLGPRNLLTSRATPL